MRTKEAMQRENTIKSTEIRDKTEKKANPRKPPENAVASSEPKAKTARKSKAKEVRKCFAEMECRGRCRASIIATMNGVNSVSEQSYDDYFIHFFSKNSLWILRLKAISNIG